MLVMDSLDIVTGVRIEAVANYLESLKGEESIRAVAKRAKVAHSVLADLLRRESMPKADTLRKLGKALGANEATLLKLSGYLEGSPYQGQFDDPEVVALVEQLQIVPPAARANLFRAFQAMIEVAAASGAERTVQEELHDAATNIVPESEEYRSEQRAKQRRSQ